MPNMGATNTYCLLFDKRHPVRLCDSSASVMLIMIDPLYRNSFIGVCLLLVMGGAHAQEPGIKWPSDWQVEDLSAEQGAAAQSPVQSRQRAAKLDEAGDPLMVMELTQSHLQPGHEVNVEGVLLEMRKSVQVNFARSGFQSVCTRVRETTLSVIPALETTCTITQNGVHVMTQTLVAAANREAAWSLSYAGSAAGYAANKDQALQIRETLSLQ